MREDPIVEEVRKVRDAIAKEHGFDLDSIVQALQRAEKASGRPLVALPPKRLPERPPDRKVC